MAIEQSPELETHLGVFSTDQLEALEGYAAEHNRQDECRRIGAELLKRTTEIADPNEA